MRKRILCAKVDMITKHEILKALEYKDGVFKWRYRHTVDMRHDQARGSWNARYAGKEAGSVDRRSGKVFIMLSGKRYQRSKLIRIIEGEDNE